MDTLYFHSKSADKKVGEGKNEYININNYDELNNIKDWRKVLSNFYIAPFSFDNLTFNTVEHAFQYYKIKLVNPKIAFSFCLESNSILSKGDGLIARKNRKIIILNSLQLYEWNKIKNKILEEILLLKFTQNYLPNKVLLLTKNAILTHSIRSKPIRQIELENVRKILQLKTIFI